MNESRFSNTSIRGSIAAATKGIAVMAVEPCMFTFLNFSAFFGNMLVCLSFYRNPSLRRTTTNYLVLSLAITDLSMAVIVMPLVVSGSIANKWVAGDFGCKLCYVCGFTSAGASTFTVMLIAVNRYFRVARPNLYPRVFSKKRTIIMAVSIWTAVVAAVLSRSLTSFTQLQTTLLTTHCFVFFADTSGFPTVTVVRNVGIIIPSLVIVICYVKIWQTIRHHNTTITILSQEGHSVYGVEEAKVTRIMTVVVVGFYFCWLPVFISNILRHFDAIRETIIKFWSFCFLFPVFTGSVINPVIYATMSRPFRKEFLKILRGGN